MADVKIENSSAETKNAIRNIVNGINNFTIGDGGDYATIADAITFIATQTLFDSVDISAFTFDVTQNSDFVVSSGFITGILKPNDFLFLPSGDEHTAGAFGQEDFHYYPVQYVTRAASVSLSAGFILEMGIIGATRSGLTLQAFRPRKFVIELLVGEHLIDSDISLPEGADIVIIGKGSSSPVVGDGTAASIAHQRWGRISYQNVSSINNSLLKAATVVSNFPNIGNATYAIRMNDVRINGSGGELFEQVTAASCIIKNLEVSGLDDHGYQITADRHEIDGLIIENHTVWENMYLHSGTYHSTSSKTKVFQNITLKRPVDLASGFVNLSPMISKTSVNIIGNTAIFKIINFVCLDSANHVDADNLEIVNPVSGNFECHITNGVIGSTGAHGSHLETTGANGKLFLTNVKRDGGGELVITDGGASIIRDTNKGVATVASGNTSIVVNHELNRTPLIEEISITPTNNKGSASEFWISNITATQFTINVDVDPGATTAIFAWKI